MIVWVLNRWMWTIAYVVLLGWLVWQVEQAT